MLRVSRDDKGERVLTHMTHAYAPRPPPLDERNETENLVLRAVIIKLTRGLKPLTEFYVPTATSASPPAPHPETVRNKHTTKV
jgi:hypothetical protein